jgi:hypothetical protein
MLNKWERLKRFGSGTQKGNCLWVTVPGNQLAVNIHHCYGAEMN